MLGFLEVCITVKSLPPSRHDEGCELTIFTPAARPSLSDDGIDSYLRPAHFLYVLGLAYADLFPQNFEALMNGADGGSMGLSA